MAPKRAGQWWVPGLKAPEQMSLEDSFAPEFLGAGSLFCVICGFTIEHRN